MLVETVLAKQELTADKVEIKFRQPFKLPEAGSDIKYVYVYGLDPKAPFETAHVGGLNFEKRVFSPDKSLAGSEDKYFPPRLLKREWTEKQAEAYRERAKEHWVRVKGGEQVCVADYIIVRKESEFTAPPDIQKEAALAATQKELNESRDEVARLKQAIIELQAKPIPGGKKNG